MAGSPKKVRRKRAETDARKFEIWIARIERAIAPTGAIVTTPDRIKDKDGQHREVDASIRHKVGSVEVLITIECRKRTAVQDSTWIEQLATKKINIGASETIAVSASRFAKKALKTAARFDIQIRNLTEKSADDFSNWLKAREVTVVRKFYEVAGVEIEYHDQSLSELSSANWAEFKEKREDAEIFTSPHVPTRKFSVAHFLIEWVKRHGTYFPEQIPADGTTIYRTLHQPFDPTVMYIDTQNGLKDVKMIHIKLGFSQEKAQSVPFSCHTDYTSPAGSLVQSAVAELPGQFSTGIHRELSSGQIFVDFAASIVPPSSGSPPPVA